MRYIAKKPKSCASPISFPTPTKKKHGFGGGASTSCTAVLATDFGTALGAAVVDTSSAVPSVCHLAIPGCFKSRASRTRT